MRTGVMYLLKSLYSEIDTNYKSID